MRFYLDTEFNGQRGELISLALVSEWSTMAATGQKFEHYFYAAQRIKSQPTEWVREHVIPVLRTPILSRARFRDEFQSFVKSFAESEFICDWHADAEHFCQMLSGRDYQTSLDFPCAIRILKTPSGVPVSKLPHNALEDARALRDWHQALLLAA